MLVLTLLAMIVVMIMIVVVMSDDDGKGLLADWKVNLPRCGFAVVEFVEQGLVGGDEP